MAPGWWPWPCVRLRQVSGLVDSEPGPMSSLWAVPSDVEPAGCHVLWPEPKGSSWLPRAPKPDPEPIDARL